MSGGELDFGAHIEDHDIASADATSQLLSVDGVETVALAEVGVDEAFEPRRVLGGHVPQRGPQLADPITGQCVEDPGAVPTGREQAGARHGAQMVGRVGDRLIDLGSDLLDRPLSLREHVDDLGAPPARQRLGPLGEPLVQRVLGGAVTHGRIVCSRRQQSSVQMMT